MLAAVLGISPGYAKNLLKHRLVEESYRRSHAMRLADHAEAQAALPREMGVCGAAGGVASASGLQNGIARWRRKQVALKAAQAASVFGGVGSCS